METTEAEAIKDVMNLLETEPPSESDHREQLAILVASGNCKEFLGVQLTQEQIKSACLQGSRIRRQRPDFANRTNTAKKSPLVNHFQKSYLKVPATF